MEKSTKNMEKVYKKNFISNFIVRLDLENKLDEGDYDSILNLLNSDYPINEKIDIKNRNIILKNESKSVEPILSEPELKVRQVLYNTDRTERIIINSDSIVFETLKYVSFNKIKPILEKVITSLKEDYGIKNYNRIGLRFVNQIKQPIKDKKEIFEWDGYINNNLLLKNCFIDNEKILQEIQTIEFKIDDEKNLLCRLRYGIPNRNMPADLMEKIFLIDIDGFTNSMIEQDDVIEVLDIIHDKNIEIFENIIDNKLRREMDE